MCQVTYAVVLLQKFTHRLNLVVQNCQKEENILKVQF